MLFSDIIIDCENSTGFIESGKGHKIMKCVMKKALTNSTVRFYWHRSNGQLQPGREIYFKDCELSQKTVVTDMYAIQSSQVYSENGDVKSNAYDQNETTA